MTGPAMPTRTIRSSPSLANVRYEIRGRLAQRAHEMERRGTTSFR